MSLTAAVMLSDRPSGRIRPELDGLRRVLAAHGDPQREFPSILVVGTNGKGSTAAMLEAVLRAHGLRTGLFTSPHLVRVTERVCLDGQPVVAQRLEEVVRRFDDAPHLTYFETLTAAAFTIFSEVRVDVAVLEAGMGGSWDATRLAGSTIAGITNVGSDHVSWLGSDPAAIARDKGQALAAAARSVVGAGVDEELVRELAAPAALRARSLVQCADNGDGRVLVTWNGCETVIALPLAGSFQIDNLGLALALALEAERSGLLGRVDPETVCEAIEGVSWPGRLSVHRIGGREVLIDCAHNLEAAEALARHLDFVGTRYNLLFSCLDDKPVEAMAAALRPQVGEIVVCPVDDQRAMPVARLQTAFLGASVAQDPRSALGRITDPVLATGSVRLVGELLALEDGGVVR